MSSRDLGLAFLSFLSSSDTSELPRFGGVSANAGFTGLMFRGMPIISDDKCTSGSLFMLNENYLDLYELSPDAAFVSGTQQGFGWTGWKKPTNQDVIVSQLLWYGQLVGTEPRKHSRRVSITS